MKTFLAKTFRRTAQRIRNKITQKGLILMYHRLADIKPDTWSLSVSPGHFSEHLEVIKKNYRFMDVHNLVRNLENGGIPRRSVTITFDDGYADNLHIAKPLLERYEIPATVFLTTRYLGTNLAFWWDELENVLLKTAKLPESLSLSINGHTYRWQLVDDEVKKNHSSNSIEESHSSRDSLLVSVWRILRPLKHTDRLQALSELRGWANLDPASSAAHRTLSPEEALELAKGNLIEIGAHTETHPVLSALSLTEQRNEIGRSKTHIEEIIGKAVTSFAYPFGGKDDYTPGTVSIVRETGFACACSNTASVVERSTDPFQLPRVHIGDCNGDEFSKKLSMWFDA